MFGRLVRFWRALETFRFKDEDDYENRDFLNTKECAREVAFFGRESAIAVAILLRVLVAETSIKCSKFYHFMFGRGRNLFQEKQQR